MNAELGQSFSLASDGKELLPIPAAPVVVSPKDLGERATEHHARAFPDAGGIQVAEDRDFGMSFPAHGLLDAGLFRGNTVQGTPGKAKPGGQSFDLVRVQNNVSLLMTLDAKRTLFYQNLIR